ncbi:hypothetical protein [Trichococcus collinsii]|uniref:Multi-ubiquitin domain-containing protein n=1 Tax=Trichococcus collinsii TaxID=157076 RepID=A0A143Z8C5_9LACT|nr:hypothetical protein [Trichococcus collinsii]CZR10373.1 Hypothetical protein Tcol_3003 [Trichococcus collinsii]CZR10594.1 Hypothetical protein Tcol_3055 [Trichococcus collinsii]SEA97777.1 hypothetical protein SAMN04488525_1175 [Trichococcus collinsii]
MNKIIQIVINGVPKQVEKRDYTFQEVISLAFGSYFPENQSYTITTTRKNDDQSKQKDVYSYGDLIKMKEDMRINVDSTNRS